MFIHVTGMGNLTAVEWKSKAKDDSKQFALAMVWLVKELGHAADDGRV